ncbi:hypothetical protein AAZX31_15G144900 [Glycine max]|uniref:PPM-type phosphatase domain-containing protein n=1 Tax=Glycine soja TaxID=3848 RepID=A0A445GTV1_GLYSO|nr:hypothetical protein GLYMA_15G152500v4 [Glycine max]KAH1147279.1 hypothetical protein GYH30_042448 [Glycine max]RZB64730.1 hypothetical protein D0Y65_040994 [Glycine soja]
MEAEHIMQSRGRVFCLEDEPGVYRVWMPNGKTPGLAISRNLVTQRWGTECYFQPEAMKIVDSASHKEKAAQRLVKCAMHKWKRKRRGIAIDDISAICLFFHSHPSHQLLPTKIVQ